MLHRVSAEVGDQPSLTDKEMGMWKRSTTSRRTPRSATRSCRRFSKVRGELDSFDTFVEKCMSEYDLDGWTTPPWDVNN